MTCLLKKQLLKKLLKKREKTKVVKKEEIAIDLNNKGIGPVKSVTLDKNINKNMVADGKLLFKNKCSSCHKVNRKFIGPSMEGVTARRSPEWIMNMILNPE
ncbi:c-type cytochrome, partial [Polaribacter sejongensis]|uniref:c-type cytochrome n=1 Tax=Polaribacter sejongensis TaxID=985043 RepID=UPI001AD820A0